MSLTWLPQSLVLLFYRIPGTPSDVLPWVRTRLHQLLVDTSLMTAALGTNLVAEDDQFRLHVGYFC